MTSRKPTRTFRFVLDGTGGRWTGGVGECFNSREPGVPVVGAMGGNGTLGLGRKLWGTYVEKGSWVG